MRVSARSDLKILQMTSTNARVTFRQSSSVELRKCTWKRLLLSGYIIKNNTYKRKRMHWVHLILKKRDLVLFAILYQSLRDHELKLF